MNPFDEEELQRALRETANGFAVSNDAKERILDEARDLPTSEKRRRIHSFVERTGRVRSSVMAAAACVVVLAVAVPLVNAESPAMSAAGAHRPLVQTNAEKIAIPGAVSGTGFESGIDLPQSEAQILGLTSPVQGTSATGLAVTVTNAKSSTSDSSEATQ